MFALFRYRIVVVVRQSEESAQLVEDYNGEFERMWHVSATNEGYARKKVLEQAWNSGFLVSRFSKVVRGGKL